MSERLRLLAFELLVGTPTALRVLVEQLGLRGALALVPAFVARALGPDPFRALGPPLDRRDRLSRRQLRQALLLDDALASRALPLDRRRALVTEVVSRVGAAFVRLNVPLPARARWESLDATGRRALVASITARFFNAEGAAVDDPAHDLAFDVSACHFARLLRALGREALAPAFCRADEVHFGQPDVPLRLSRLRTIAGGDERCEFRFRWKDGEPPDTR